MQKIRNKKELKSFRISLRKNMPAPEVILWQKIRSKSLGVKFRRQFSVNSYILDFFAAVANLAIELDGDSHFENQESAEADKIRDAGLAKQGIKVLRFTNRDIMENLDGVLDTIQKNLPPLDLPLIMGEKGERSP